MSINHDYLELVRHAKDLLKEGSIDYFSTKEEWESLHKTSLLQPKAKNKDAAFNGADKQTPSMTYNKRKEPPSQIPVEEQIPDLPAAPKQHLPIKKTLFQGNENTKDITDVLRRIAPGFPLAEHIPDDARAKKVASAWQEALGDADVALLACDVDAQTVELLRNLARSINQKLAKVKVISVERLEREKRWDLFLEKNAFELIIASSGLNNLKEAMSYFKSLPASSEQFLKDTPLILLSPPILYSESPKEKTLLWKRICQILKIP